MKRFLVVLFSLLSIQALKAQDNVRGGVYFVGGLNFASAAGWDDPSTANVKRITLFNAGIGYTQLISRDGKMGIQAEVAFSQKGFGNSAASNSTDAEKMVLNYIDVPLQFKYRPFGGSPSLYVAAGPQVGFQVGGHVKYVNGDKADLNRDVITKTTWSGVGAVGINFGNMIDAGLELSYEHGLSKFIETETNLRHSGFRARLMLPLDFIFAALASF